MKAHPLLRVEFVVADELQNLIAEGADVAIRLGKLTDSAFGARKLATMQRRVVASPAYLKARGTPKTPADLSAHDCIFGPGPGARQSWSFTRNGAVTSVDVHTRLQTNSAPTVFACLLAGLGIAVASDAMCHEQLKTGELVEVLRGYKLEPVEVHALFPAGPRPSAKVRAFVDYLADALSRA
jgi:DNA-binding transcriptional LysR family regulator